MKLWRSNFWILTLFGSVVLLNIAVRVFRSPAGFDGADYFDCGFNAFLIVGIWFVYRRQLKDLDKLAEQVEEKALVRLSSTTFSIALVAYLSLMMAVSHVHRH